MKKVAQFDKVSFGQFKKDWNDTFSSRPEQMLKEIYDNIKLPERKTKYSAGHDFHVPCDFCIEPGGRVMIPTGVKCTMNSNYAMQVFPRSSLGIKKGMCISNTIPIIDADYINANNEGHIFISIENHGTETILLNSGESFVQAIFVEYGIADRSKVDTERSGGIGSTGK